VKKDNQFSAGDEVFILDKDPIFTIYSKREWIEGVRSSMNKVMTGRVRASRLVQPKRKEVVNKNGKITLSRRENLVVKVT